MVSHVLIRWKGVGDRDSQTNVKRSPKELPTKKNTKTGDKDIEREKEKSMRTGCIYMTGAPIMMGAPITTGCCTITGGGPPYAGVPKRNL